jgi:hypothetical protein
MISQILGNNIYGPVEEPTCVFVLILSPLRVIATEEIVNIWEEVFSVPIDVHDEEADSRTRVRVLSKNLIPSLPYRITRDGVSET